MKQQAIIVAHDLAAGYITAGAEKIIFQATNFSLDQGEFVGILGPNGAGKTTLFKLLLGLLRPLRGELTIFGKAPERGNPKIGYVPQHHDFDGELMIEALEIVRLGLYGRRWGFSWPRQKKIEEKAALAMLREVGAEELAHRPLNTLSGGELQRIFLAEALMGQPDILLLDEPLANLDLRREAELINLIKNIVVSRRITILLIAHNINPLLPVLDRAVYVANNHVAVGETGAVFNSAALSKLYNSPVEVLRDSRGRLAVIGAEEGAHHHQH